MKNQKLAELTQKLENTVILYGNNEIDAIKLHAKICSEISYSYISPELAVMLVETVRKYNKKVNGINSFIVKK